MKIEDLRNILEVLEVTEKDEKGETQSTQAFRELCTEMVNITRGPSKLYELVTQESIAAIANVVAMNELQAMRVKRIVSNTAHVLIGTLINGNVMSVNAPNVDVKVASISSNIAKRLMEALTNAGAVRQAEEDKPNGYEDEFGEEDNKPLTKKEVVH